MNKDLKSVFEEYAAFGRPGVTKDITSKNFSKLVKEKGLLDKKLNTTEVDMVFTRAKGGPGNKVLTYAQFENALKMCCKSKYESDSEENYNKIKDQICGGGGPSTSGTTGVSKTGGVEKLTDASKYTGSHKERFDESGKGRGISGRKNLSDKSGYVQAYKGKDTYDEKH